MPRGEWRVGELRPSVGRVRPADITNIIGNYGTARDSRQSPARRSRQRRTRGQIEFTESSMSLASGLKRVRHEGAVLECTNI